MSKNATTDSFQTSLALEEKKDSETECETESDSDAIFDGLTKANAESLRSQISAMTAGLSVQAEQHKRDEFQDVKRSFQIRNALDLKDEEVRYCIDFCKRHGMNVKEMIEKEGLSFLALMREMMKDDQEPSPMKAQSNSGRASGEVKLEKKTTECDEDYTPEKVMKVNRRKVKRAVKNNTDETVKKKIGYNRDGSKRVGRILLDEALKTKDTNMNGWSDARKKAYKAIGRNPNAYHYRFNKAGEAHARGSWTKEEHKQFMTLLLEKGANHNWGLFSIKIPGRVGYQCSNYYRFLVKYYKIWDPNYWYDGKKLYFKRGQGRDGQASVKFSFTVLEDGSGVFGKLPAQHPKRPSTLQSPEEIKRIASKGFSADPPEGFNVKHLSGKTQRKTKKRTASSVTRKRKRARTSNDSDSDCNVGMRNLASMQAAPGGGTALPKFIDPFTKCLIISPAISPYGHVCEYDMWTKVLRTPGAKDICPFTRKPVTRRQLVKLTTENIDEYKSKVINQDHALKEWSESRLSLE